MKRPVFEGRKGELKSASGEGKRFITDTVGSEATDGVLKVELQPVDAA